MPYDTYNVGCYLLDRLAEVGCEHLFGVPGDFNLRFLDDVMAHRLKWIGCANELNASYAVDGYARRTGIGAILTTCGVGELSAINGIAGSAAENIPVIHIAGAPSTKSCANRELLHHSLADGNFRHFHDISAELCCTAVTLLPENAVRDIDRVITDVFFYKKPGYIGLPIDVAVMPVSPPTAKLVRREPEFAKDSLDAFKQAVRTKLETAKNPAVLVGHFIDRYDLSEQANCFLGRVHVPYAVSAIGKGAVAEHLENFVGTYLTGPIPCPSKSVVESADVCILLGVVFTDAVTSNFQHKINLSNAINVHPFFSEVGSKSFQQLPMSAALLAVEEVCLEFHSRWSTAYPQPETFKPAPDANVFSAAHLWKELQASLAPDDIVVVDLGTSAFTSLLLRMPERSHYICQLTWASIGFSLPAALGAQIAEPHRRVICVVGDGAAQMSIQEIGTFARLELNPTFLLVNNAGYTIERFIRGMEAAYNDIAVWNWTGLVKNFCPRREPKTETITSVGAVKRLLDSRRGDQDEMVFAEVMLDKFEGPLRSSVDLGNAAAKK